MKIKGDRFDFDDFFFFSPPKCKVLEAPFAQRRGYQNQKCVCTLGTRQNYSRSIRSHIRANMLCHDDALDSNLALPAYSQPNSWHPSKFWSSQRDPSYQVVPKAIICYSFPGHGTCCISAFLLYFCVAKCDAGQGNVAKKI